MRPTLALFGLTAVIACSSGEIRAGGGAIDDAISISDVLIAPAEPTTTTPLTVTATIADSRDRELAVDYAWYVDDQIVLQGAETTLDPAQFVRDQAVFVEIVVSAGRSTSAPVRSEPVLIRNTPPTLAGVTLDPAEPTSADPLTCAAQGITDDDGDAVTLRYRWLIDGTPLALDSDTLPARSAARGQTVQCEVTPTDGTDLGEPFLSPEALIGNGAPLIASVVIAPQPAFTTSLLTVTPSVSDPDGDPISLRWRWTVNGAEVGTTAALTADRFVRGDTVQVRGVAFDGETESAPRTSDPLTIANSPPTAPAVALGPELAPAGRPIVCEIETASTDADGDGITYVFDFFRDGEAYTGRVITTDRPNDTVPGAEVGEGEVWTCAAQAWDRIDTSRFSAESAPLLIGPPEIEFDIAVGDLVNQDLTCGPSARYNVACRGDYGFSWFDDADSAPREIEVRYNHSLNCSFSVADRNATVNGTRVGAAPVGDERSCNCTTEGSTWERSITFAPPDTYRPGGENTFLITPQSCEGFAPNADWTLDDDTLIYARVILRY